MNQDPMSDDERQSAGDASSDECTIETDEVFHLLQNSRRRAVVQYFTTHDEPISLSDLADEVAAREYETTVEDVTDDQHQRIYIALYQSHLDKLDGHNVVEYDTENKTVAPGPALHELCGYPATEPVEIQETAETSVHSDEDAVWASGYLGIALGGFIPVSGRFFHVLPSEAISLQVLNAILILACLVIASLHYFTTR